jgi:hypothetical protein
VGTGDKESTMNKIKWASAAMAKEGARPFTAAVQQNPSPEQYTQRLPWNSPARVKARLISRGFVLVGKRQG